MGLGHVRYAVMAAVRRDPNNVLHEHKSLANAR